MTSATPPMARRRRGGIFIPLPRAGPPCTIFIATRRARARLAKKATCARCSAEARPRYVPMESWKVPGPLCGKCYSHLIDEHYDGEHVRV